MTLEPFDIIPLQRNTLLPMGRQLLDSVQKTPIHSVGFLGQSDHHLFWVPKTDSMHGFFQLEVQAIVTRTQIWAIDRLWKGFPAIFCEVNDNAHSMNPAIVKNDDAFLEHTWSVFADF